MRKLILLSIILVPLSLSAEDFTEFETDIRQCVSLGIHMSALMTLRQTEIEKVAAREMFQKSGAPLNSVFLDFTYEQEIVDTGTAKQAMINSYKYQTIVRCYESVYEKHGIEHLKSTELTSPIFN